MTRLSGASALAASLAAPAAGAGVAASGRVRPDARLLGLLSVGHLVVDTIQGALPALLPLLKTAVGLSGAAAGTDRWRLPVALRITALMPVGGFGAALLRPEPAAR